MVPSSMAKYFVAYAYFLKNGGHGFGNIEADRSWPIAGQADINELTEHITDSLCRAMNQPSLTLTILGWQRFEDDIERKRPEPGQPSNVISLHPS